MDNKDAIPVLLIREKQFLKVCGLFARFQLRFISLEIEKLDLKSLWSLYFMLNTSFYSALSENFVTKSAENEFNWCL